MPKKEGLFGKLVDYLGFGPEEDEFTDEGEAQVPAEEWQPSVVKQPADRRTPVISLNQAAPLRQGNFKILVVEPRAFEEVQTIVDQMRAKRPVILNLESVDKDVAQKILNFLNGAIYALGGETQRVSHCIFFYAPQGVDISTMGRGLTGTAIGGGAVDLPPGLLEKLTGVAAREETAATRNSREELDTSARSRRTESERERPKYDWRNK